jgi:hypothetical protein
MLRPKTYIFNVNLRSTIFEIKNEFRSFLIENNDPESRIPLSMLGLKFDSNLMQDSNILEDYNVTKDATIFVYVQIKKSDERMPSFILM